MRPVAFVTGASRGIGKATALALAEAGLDVAFTARTRSEGDARDEGDTGAGRTLPGSLETTAKEVEARGARALPLTADLLEPLSLERAVADALAALGRIDVLVNNAVHSGPGSMTAFLDTPIAHFVTKVQANYLAQLVVIKSVLPSMLERGSGTIINVTSYSGTHDPTAPVGEGGWGLAYSASKGAFHRVAGILAVELGPRGIKAFNVDPGHVVTERMQANADLLGLAGKYGGAPPTAPALAIAWLATSEHAAALNGKTVNGLRLALDNGHPDWRTA
jgi:NAD(P)-dependent dehydrogenase (short-subunit alcohol dehydrogenase family)